MSPFHGRSSLPEAATRPAAVSTRSLKPTASFAPAAGSPALEAELTTREREVLARIALGESNPRIAQVLQISLHTVKHHVGNIIGKLGVHTRAEAVARYLARRQDAV